MDSGNSRILGVLAGRDMPLPQLAAWALSADLLLAADGGANYLLDADHAPSTTIGDLDSLVRHHRLQRVIQDPNQDTSDCDKLLDFAWRAGYGQLTLIGVEGDRLDHVVATLASASRSSVQVRLALRRGLGWILKPGQEYRFTAQVGELVSLLPLENCRGTTLTGVKWPLDEANLSVSTLVSLSNEATSTAISAQLSEGAAMLTILSPRLESPTW